MAGLALDSLPPYQETSLIDYTPNDIPDLYLASPSFPQDTASLMEPPPAYSTFVPREMDDDEEDRRPWSEWSDDEKISMTFIVVLFLWFIFCTSLGLVAFVQWLNGSQVRPDAPVCPPSVSARRIIFW
ncbi:hypothetical protein GLAREA_00841 [Glarea lozoyensis ATCC 20868]|uniref:Uncharacterized protein n=1 Tax=Glarea lozoyensis (strain ATCC 20868 / MF5171) TaxID=1116229 RepID=S3DCE5_GLAL2|nr:uncharacterized protein GLAREA_00841 [Glarea lozoyensis ATCC 20868]EPE29681.1 hypothetical protein GLAREA_00841 [Glarea lozoyensis ATCC 20868]